MVEAGLVKVSLAIESGSEYIRNKIMRKKLTTEKIYDVVEICSKHTNLFIVGYFVIGMPEETLKTLQETYDMIKKLPLDNFAIYFATPYPGTELFDFCIKHNLLLHKKEDYVEIDDMHYDSYYPHLKPFKLTIDDLISFRKQCIDLLKEKRGASGLPVNYPLRYKQT
jgi:radical SAM superfamily enzyme YgiQ (UPF0313 family)